MKLTTSEISVSTLITGKTSEENPNFTTIPKISVIIGAPGPILTTTEKVAPMSIIASIVTGGRNRNTIPRIIS